MERYIKYTDLKKARSLDAMDGMKFITNVLVMFLILFILAVTSFNQFSGYNYVSVIVLLILLEMGFLFTRYKHHFVGLFIALALLVSLIMLLLYPSLITIVAFVLTVILGIYNYYEDAVKNYHVLVDDKKESREVKKEQLKPREKVEYIDYTQAVTARKQRLSASERKRAEQMMVDNKFKVMNEFAKAQQNSAVPEKLIAHKITQVVHHPECPIASKITSNNMTVVKKKSLLYKTMKKHWCLKDPSYMKK